MIRQLKALAEEHGARLEAVPAERIADLRAEIEAFAREQPLNGFQEWIIHKIYSFIIPPASLSVLIMAVPFPAYADIVFRRNGRAYALYGTVAAPLDKAKRYIAKAGSGAPNQRGIQTAAQAVGCAGRAGRLWPKQHHLCARSW